jgi:hypothetical protein
MATKNRFEQVNERQDDAITLSLSRQEGSPSGFLICPASLLGGRTSEDQISRPMSALDAFRSAVKLANEIKAPVVVLDPEGLWQSDWGELYREEL